MAVLKALYEAMAERRLSITLNAGSRARTLGFDLPPFTLVAATTEEGVLPAPFLGRIGLREALAPYAREVLAGLVTAKAAEEGAAKPRPASRGSATTPWGWSRWSSGTWRCSARAASRCRSSVSPS